LLDESGHDTGRVVDPKGERRDVEQERDLKLFRDVIGENGGLNGSTASNSFIRVEGLLGLLAAEVIGDELDDVWDASEATD
jgi:hypothetical protein